MPTRRSPVGRGPCSLDVIIIGVLLMYLYVRNYVLFERLFLLIFDIVCACRLYLMNCVIEGNGNANLFLTSRDVSRPLSQGAIN